MAFAILLPETDEQETFRTAEKVRTKAAERPFHFETRTFGPITLSIGAAAFPNVSDDTDRLIKIADVVFYEAKRTGRNKTIMAETEKPSSSQTTELTT